MHNKTLSIIIPHYTETIKDIFPTLSSINNQVGIDFNRIECILVNDGGQNTLPDEGISLFNNLSISRVNMPENRGPGVARQQGIDNANGEYVMFCDADDLLHSVAVLGVFLQEIDAYHPDIITSPWLEELRDSQTGQYIYLNHSDEITWMHGKVFRRKFLQTKNIRFHDDLRIHEDSYFLALAFAYTDNIRQCSFTSYLWRFLPDSITRRNGAGYTYESMPTFMEAIALTYPILEASMPDIMQYKVIQFVMYNYFILHRFDWQMPENSGYLARTEEAFKVMMSPYLHYLTAVAPEYIATIYNQERLKHFTGSIETEPLAAWLHRIMEQYEV